MFFEIDIADKESSNNKRCKNPLKARFSNIYIEKLYIDYYHFIQKCKNDFLIT